MPSDTVPEYLLSVQPLPRLATPSRRSKVSVTNQPRDIVRDVHSIYTLFPCKPHSTPQLLIYKLPIHKLILLPYKL